MLLAITKNVISELNEEVDRKRTSDKWWFDSCKCSILLVFLILEKTSSHCYIVPNIFTTCSVWAISLGNHPDGRCGSYKNQGCRKQEA